MVSQLQCWRCTLYFCTNVYIFSRHQALVHSLTLHIRSAGIRVTNEVQVGGRERPADIFVHHWTTEYPVAVGFAVGMK